MAEPWGLMRTSWGESGLDLEHATHGYLTEFITMEEEETQSRARLEGGQSRGLEIGVPWWVWRHTLVAIG